MPIRPAFHSPTAGTCRAPGRITPRPVGAEFAADPWSTFTYTAPAAETHLVTFRDSVLVTYSGHQSGFSSWWTNHKILDTSNGTSAGTIEVRPQPVQPRRQLRRLLRALSTTGDSAAPRHLQGRGAAAFYTYWGLPPSSTRPTEARGREVNSTLAATTWSDLRSGTAGARALSHGPQPGTSLRLPSWDQACFVGPARVVGHGVRGRVKPVQQECGQQHRCG